MAVFGQIKQVDEHKITTPKKEKTQINRVVLKDKRSQQTLQKPKVRKWKCS